MKLSRKDITILISFIIGVIVLSLFIPRLSYLLFTWIFFLLPYELIKKTLMGRKKREFIQQMIEEIDKMIIVIGSIAYEKTEEINILEEILKSPIDLTKNNHRFIKREVKLYLKAREIFDGFINKFYLDSNRVLIDKIPNEIIAEEAQNLIAEIIKIKDAIIW